MDPRLPLGPDGKPVGTIRADGVVDVTGKTTALPVNGQLTPEQAKELGLVGPAGPAGSVPVPINPGMQLTPQQFAEYKRAEEERAKQPAREVPAARLDAAVNQTGQQPVVGGIPIVTGPANGQGQV